jgi:hypothetical protein
VHHIRYWLAYGPQAGTQLADQGHAYMASFVPWIAVITAAGAGLFATRLAHARRGGGLDDRAYAFRAVWLSTSALLVAIYALQEALEELFASGHPAGLTGIFGHGGWWAIPVAVAVAFVVALLLRAGAALVRRAAQRAPQCRPAATVPRLSAAVLVPRRRPLAAAAAGRAPPRLLVACV